METTVKKTTAQLKAEKFVLTCTATGQFPSFNGSKQLTTTLEETHVFDGRDNPVQKVNYYNALYKSAGVSFTAFHF